MIDPQYMSVGELFRDEYTFFIPKYQRNYAWDDERISDFLSDLNKCYEVREKDKSLHHFFGGIVSVESKVTGSARRQQELIDGQQRVATFVMLMASLISIYKNLLTSAVASGDVESRKLVDQRIKQLTRKYLRYDDEVNRRIQTVDRLVMSKPDDMFFKNMIYETPQTERENGAYQRLSHKRLEEAYSIIKSTVKDTIQPLHALSDKLDALKLYEEILNDDFTVIHIITSSKKEAYHLFQVLNDRGVGLTEGDLLKSKTMEMLESKQYQEQQMTVENSWNDILADSAGDTKNYLNWYYSSYKGKRASQSNLLDNFIEAFFPYKTDMDGIVKNKVDADAVAYRVSDLRKEVMKCRQLVKGEWPYEKSTSVWHQDRLKLLITGLNHTNCMPLLLAAAMKADHKSFEAIVELVERFVFRYKIISNQHISSLTKVYLDHAVDIRTNPAKYKVNKLCEDLRALEDSRATDEVFRTNLSQLEYNERGGNKPLKYFLMTLEHFARWYYEGAINTPKCMDDTRVFDFDKTTIEHVYARNAEVKDPELEGVVHSLGNLTFMGPGDNNLGANKSFAEKKSILADSSVLLNQKLAEASEWTKSSVQERQEHLLDMALKIFSMKC